MTFNTTGLYASNSVKSAPKAPLPKIRTKSRIDALLDYEDFSKLEAGQQLVLDIIEYDYFNIRQLGDKPELLPNGVYVTSFRGSYRKEDSDEQIEI